jgi:hypothetical protein
MLELILSGPLPGIGITTAQLVEVYRVPIAEIERLFGDTVDFIRPPEQRFSDQLIL